MKFIIAIESNCNLKILARRLGYHPHYDGFTRRLSANFYPRFHLHLENLGNQIKFSLHLDQKKASYSGQTAHSGEYDGGLLAQERQRIEKVVAALE